MEDKWDATRYCWLYPADSVRQQFMIVAALSIERLLKMGLIRMSKRTGSRL